MANANQQYLLVAAAILFVLMCIGQEDGEPVEIHQKVITKTQGDNALANSEQILLDSQNKAELLLSEAELALQNAMAGASSGETTSPVIATPGTTTSGTSTSGTATPGTTTPGTTPSVSIPSGGIHLKTLHEQIDFVLTEGNSIERVCDDPSFLPPSEFAEPVTLRVPTSIKTWEPSGTIEEYHRAHVEEMLAPWAERGIPKSLLYDHPPEFFDNSRGGCQNPVRIKIKDQKLYVKFSQHMKAIPFMNKRKLYTVSYFDDYVKRCAAVGDCPDFESHLCYADMSWEATKGIGFHLVWGGKDSGTLAIPVGEHNMPETIQKSSDDLLVKTRAWRDKFPWEQRKEIGIFRGGGSGRLCVWNVDGLGKFVPETPENSEKLSHLPKNCARARLVDVFKNCDPSKKYIDVGIDAPYISLADQESYKYIIYSEGNSGWANRLRSLLAMKNVVLQQIVPTYMRTGSEPRGEVWSGQEWFTRYIEFWVHTVPVDKQWSNLAALVKWLKENDDLAQKISENADKFCEFFFSVKSLQVYSDLLIRGYANLQQWDVTVEADDIPIENVPLNNFDQFSALVNKFGTNKYVPPGT